HGGEPWSAATTPRSTPSGSAPTHTAAIPRTYSSTSCGGSTRRSCTTAPRSPCSATSTAPAGVCPGRYGPGDAPGGDGPGVWPVGDAPGGYAPGSATAPLSGRRLWGYSPK